MTAETQDNGILSSFFDTAVSGGADVECLEFKITPYGVVTNVNGIDKYISLDSFLAAIASSSNTGEGGDLKGVLLPSNTFFFAQSATRINLSCYYAGGVRNIKYAGHDRPSVIPNIIISHSLTNSGGSWTVNSTRYFSTDRSVAGIPHRFINGVSAEEKVYGMPFTNTYSDNRMCYGSNSMPQQFRNENLRGLDWYYQYLFETPFNDDLGVSALGRRQSPADWYGKLARLAEEGQPFPYSDLAGFIE